VKSAAEGAKNAESRLLTRLGGIYDTAATRERERVRSARYNSWRFSDRVGPIDEM
jgi:hypothetical protein